MMIELDGMKRRTWAASRLGAAVLCLCACGDDGDFSASGQGTDADPSTGDATSSQTNETGETSSSSGDTDASDASDGGDGPEPSGPDGEWQTRASLSEPRQETGVAALGGEVYVIGGFTAAGLSPRVEVYDPGADTWRTVADFPDAGVHHANTAAVAGRLFVASYLSGNAFGAVGRTFSYDPSLDEWSEHAQMPVGTERGGSGVAVLGDTIYVLGGMRGIATVGDAWTYDTANDVWMPIEALPGPRDHLVAAGVDGKVYAIGGRADGIEAHVAHVDVYDPQTDAWSPGPPMPTSRGGMAAAVVSHWIFVAGGEGNVDDPDGVFSQFEVLDTVRGVWSTLTPMPMPRHGMGAAAVDGVVYVPGGADEQAFGAVATHEAWVLGD
jgi:N-acetylneuraminic acid mutarotase